MDIQNSSLIFQSSGQHSTKIAFSWLQIWAKIVEFGTSLQAYDIIIFVLGVISWIFMMHTLVSRVFPYLLQTKVVVKDQKSSSGESLYMCIYATIFQTAGMALSCREKWFTDPSAYWDPFWLPCPFSYKLIYTFQTWHYIASLVLMSKSTRKTYADRWLMCTHHLIAIILISMSYVIGQWRIGMMVFMTHDVADIFLEGAKLSRYMGEDKMKNILFVLFVFAWFIPRGLIFPTRVIHPSLCLYNTVKHDQTLLAFYYTFNALLILLFCISSLWSIWIIGIVIRLIRRLSVLDPRSKEDIDVKYKIRSGLKKHF